MVNCAHIQEPLFKAMLDKPNSSSGHVRHDHGALNLDKLGGVVEVDYNKAGGTLVEKVEF